MACAAALALGAPVAAMAQDATTSTLRFSGFGTLGVVATDTNDAEYATSVLQPGGAKKKADAGVDSLIAGQVDWKPMDSLSFALQVVANRTADDDYIPHVEWAFGRYAVTRDLSVRAGIMAAPVFMLSDSRLVGFSYPWVRTPTALYSQVPFTNFRGADVTYRHAMGDATLSAQAYIGKAPTEVPDSASAGHLTADLDRLRGLNLGLELGNWTARVGYMQTQFSYVSGQTTQLFAGLRGIDQFIPGAAALADSLDSVDKRVSFTSVGVAYEGGNILFQSEYGKRKADLFLADTSSWYATFGYRFGNWMPHVTISDVKMDSAKSQSVIPNAGPFAPLAAGVNNLLGGSIPEQKVIALGVRYQFHKNADLKLQWDRIDLPVGSVGNFQRAVPGFAGSKVNVYSAAIDFVF